MVKKLQYKIVYNKKLLSADIIFWPGSHGRVHCNPVKLEPNQRVSFDKVPLLVLRLDFHEQTVTITWVYIAPCMSFHNATLLRNHMKWIS
jgi:hypothetical protein